VWSNSEEDVIPAGAAAKGYVAITIQASGVEYPVLQEIIKTVYGAGKGNLEDKKAHRHSQCRSDPTTLKSISNLLQAERGQITAGSIQFERRAVLRTSPADLVRQGLVQVLEVGIASAR
jgi:hypothetical protein